MNILNGITFTYSDDFTPAMCPLHYPHTHDYSELYFHIRGKCSYMVENGIYSIDYGTVVITRPNELHCVRIEEDTQYERCYYQIAEDALNFLGSDAVWRCFRDRPFGQNNVILLPGNMMDDCLTRMKRTAALFREESPDAGSVGLAELLKILHVVNEFYSRALIYSDDPHYNTLVNNALRLINRDLKNLRSVDELAAQLYVSREYLSRCFSGQVGVTPNKYITMKRIECAKTLLRRGVALDEVCTECGWNDYSYFIYVFRRETGMTPLKYRSYFSSRLICPPHQ